jgi:hypothetical protein
MINVIYRISNAGFSKVKPEYISNEKCLRNAVNAFPLDKHNWKVLADSVNDETKEMIEKYVPQDNIEHIAIKNGPGYPFMYALDQLLKESDNDNQTVYFVENDYLHRPDSDIVLQEGIDLGADYVTLYDHPDKYLNANEGGNPFIEGRGEVTQVFLSNTCHWKFTNSTTGTFAAKVGTLRDDYEIIKKHANSQYWNDFHMFLELRDKGRSLISPLPGYSTHGETAWLTPLINWNDISNNTNV